MIIGYNAWPAENKTHMWADPKIRGTPPAGVLCDACGQRIDYHAINPHYKPPRTYYDLCRTYDGDFLISVQLQDWLKAQTLSGLTFGTLKSSERYVVLQSSNILRVVRSVAYKFEEYCSVCQQHKSVWGSPTGGDRFQGINEPLQRGIYFSDIRFGYGPQMGPLMVVGVETWAGMLAQKFKGLNAGKPIII